MFRFFIFYFLFFFTVVYGSEFTDENIQIIAKNLNSKDKVITATGDVVVFSKNYYITSKKLIYNKKKRTIKFFNDVNLIKNNQQISFSQYLFIDLNKKLKIIKPMLMLDNKSQLWFNSTDTHSNKSLYNLKNSTLSSCDCVDPAWSIGFSSGDYDTKKRWVNTYNTTLYIDDFPVLYTPYFGFSTDKTRRTGLLPPIIGISKDEGFIFAQPIYYAPKLNYDLELIPQMRTNRGKGLYFNYRYKDSAYSDLKLKTGVFKEQNDYQKKNHLINNKHYGLNLNYKRTNLFSDNNTTTDGLLVNIVDMNDVDYLNTRYDNDTNTYTDKFLESNLKYYYNTNKYYGGFEIKYYDDLSQNNNDATMQTIPSINLHKYSNSLIFDNLSYSIDTEITKDTRKIGLGADTTTIYVPLTYSIPLLSDYLNLSLSEQIHYTNINYTNDNKFYNNANYVAANHIISLYTDLIKPYENFIHTFNLNITYTKPNEIKKSGMIYNPYLLNDANNNKLSLFPISGTQETIALGLFQSFYDKNTTQPLVTDKMDQVYFYDKLTKEYKKGDLENDLKVYFQYGSINNRSLYNYNLKEIISSISDFNFHYDNSYLKFSHSYSKNMATLLKNKSISYDLGFKFHKYYNLSYEEEYDLIENVNRKKQYNFGIDKKCWALSFKYINSLVATNSTTGGVTRQNIIYVEFNLKQLFNLQQRYQLKEDK